MGVVVRRQLGWVLVMVLVAGSAGVLVGRAVVSRVRADPPVTIDRGGVPSEDLVPPGPDVTPPPGSTPDTTKPFWTIPYLNQDRLSPKFKGEINGITVGIEPAEAPPSKAPPCSRPEYAPDWRKAIAGTPFDVDLAKLPPGVHLSGQPEVFVCADDGSPLWLEMIFRVEPGTEGADPAGGGTVYLSRLSAEMWWPNKAPATRWAAGSIADQPAAFMDQPYPLVGDTAVFVSDQPASGSSRFLGIGVTLRFVQRFAEGFYQ